MHRRDFLKLFSLILIQAFNSACDKKPQMQALTSNKKRIVVIGAGLAGLAAAQVLRKQDHEVLLLEARDRIGGRVWTSDKWADAPMDMGASWIHRTLGNPLTDLAIQANAKRATTSYDRIITYNTSGEPLSNAEQARLESFEKQMFAAIEKAQDGDSDVSLRQVIESLTSQFDKSSEVYRFTNFALSSQIEQEYSGSAIQWDQSPIRVITQKTEFLADHVLVTLPLGVLQSGSIKFTPQLPQIKQDAINKLAMGVLNKCYLKFTDVFWPVDVDWITHISANHGEWTDWLSLKRSSNLPILVGFNAADFGRKIEAWTDEEIVAAAMQTLRKIYGANIPEPIDYQITRWASDPFSLGSYSFNTLGGLPQMRKDLAESIGKSLFFAGEASDMDYFGTTHGAYLSGLRAAKEIMSIQLT